jgi:flavodoxin
MKRPAGAVPRKNRSSAATPPPALRAWVVYDSVSGNTRTVAQAIALSIGGHVKAVRAQDADCNEAAGLDLLVIGSPTHGGRPTEAVARFVERVSRVLPPSARVAAFDTRLRAKLFRIFGYAADRIAAGFVPGAVRLAGAEGFAVKAKLGPLAEGEVQRAADWGRQLAQGA